MTSAVLMYDSVAPANIPLAARVVAGYDDGQFGATNKDGWYVYLPDSPPELNAWKRFPNALTVHITIAGELSSQVADVEPGCMTAGGAAKWARAKVAAGLGRPTIYCSTAMVPTVNVSLRAVGLELGTDVDLWHAQWDGKAALEPVYGIMPVAKQFLGYPAGRGSRSPGPYDVSITNGTWPVVPAPKRKRDSMQTMKDDAGKDHLMAVGPDGHLLDITFNAADPSGYVVIDVTDAIAAKHPGIPPYLVQP